MAAGFGRDAGMHGTRIERVEWLFPLRGRWLRYLIVGLVIPVTLGLWGVCLFRAARFWLEASNAYSGTQTLDAGNDLNWAKIIAASYLLNFGIGLAFLLLIRRRASVFLVLCWIVNLTTAAWLLIRRPEEVIVFFPAAEPVLTVGINLLLVLFALASAVARLVDQRRLRLHG